MTNEDAISQVAHYENDLVSTTDPATSGAASPSSQTKGMTLLWLPYLLLTVILTCMAIASFINFHRKHKHRYRGRDKLPPSNKYRVTFEQRFDDNSSSRENEIPGTGQDNETEQLQSPTIICTNQAGTNSIISQEQRTIPRIVTNDGEHSYTNLGYVPSECNNRNVKFITEGNRHNRDKEYRKKSECQEIYHLEPPLSVGTQEPPTTIIDKDIDSFFSRPEAGGEEAELNMAV